jgi:hypothetical protein
MSHEYSAHGGEKSQRNVVMYHHYDISKGKQMSFRSKDDSLVSSIWQQLDKCGSEVRKFSKTNSI